MFIKTKRRQEETEENLNYNATSEYFEKYDEQLPKNYNRIQKKFLDIAGKIALNSSMLHKHGALIVHKNKIVSYGFNYRCDTLSKNYSIHAEICAINNMKNKSIFNECDMYVVRIASDTYNNILKYSKPCENCKKIINKYNIRKIYYSTNYEYDDLLNI